MTLNGSLWGLFLILANPFANRATGMEEAVVVQPQNFISVQVGGSLKLECRVADQTPPGPVKWFLGNDPHRKLIYQDKLRDQFKRVTRDKESSGTDFTITLHNATLEDTGIYYCVKQMKKAHGDDTDWESGRGTQVVVTASKNDRYIIPAVVCVLLAVLLTVAIYFYIRKKRGWNSGTSRSETSLSESTKTPNQSGDKEIVYTDLKYPERLPRAKTSGLQASSEYAAIKIRPTISGSINGERKDASLS
uniref:Ig-like domain-containing protein n=1 Tax=Anolis carolinensis TaxID=28377 RepID=H9GU27_ANOCA|nr:PREDICTED: tyrosine-protein phosphatase non-receptor type substrate 1 isoform X2 [Anolis carolinensis]|eukprot:XP_008119161.1 PREDICTED: tyrosine-protein phosphatase non-receptor type substrate 1 isoform X2 [Anolis carolinensis]